MPENRDKSSAEPQAEDIQAAEMLLEDLGPNQTRLAEEDRILTENQEGGEFLPDAKELLHEAKLGQPTDAQRAVEERRDQMTRSDSLDMTG